jgi:aspartyl-tRNA(Asn)/glutamyl-tRNA(Gln) amidotransferase subunit A
MYLTDIFTLSTNLAGIPGITIPYSTSKEGLPIGIQLLGNYFDEETILMAAYALEQRKNWRGLRLPHLP